MIGYNDMCEEYGVFHNPMKEHLKGTLWHRESCFIRPQNLPEDIVYYAACDVESLIDLYEITQSMIESDFMPYFQVILRAFE